MNSFLLLLPMQAIASSLRTKYCENVDTNSNPSIYSFFFQFINETSSNDQMIKYAKNEESLGSYFWGSYNWLYLFFGLTFIALMVLLVSFICAACPQCCSKCRRDLKRSDYKKREKTCPFVVFLIFSILSMVLAGYGIYLIIQIYENYYQMRCQSASFVEDLNNGTSNQWVGFSKITNKVVNLDSFIIKEQEKIKEIYYDRNQSWITSLSQDIDKRFQNISKTYTNYAVANFNGGKSILQVLQSGVFGPVESNTTKLGQIQQEKDDNLGNKLTNLKQVLNYSQQMYNTSFRNNVTQAVQIATLIDQSAQELYSNVPTVLDDIHPFALGALVTLFIAFCINILTFITSNVSFSLVVCTQERKYKGMSNIGWASSGVSLLLIYIACAFLAIAGFVMNDSCYILESSNTQEEFQSYPRFVSQQLGSSMQECFYGKTKSVKYAFGFQNQLDTMTNLQKSILQFNPQTKVGNNNAKLTQLIGDFQLNFATPGQLLFVDQSKRQPSAQIDVINRATNQNNPNAFQVCDQAQDQYQEGACNIANYYALKLTDSPSQNLKQKTCIDLSKFSFQFISQRYSNQQGCDEAKSSYSQYQQYYKEVAANEQPGGILRQLVNDLSSLFLVYTQVRGNITNITSSVQEQVKILNDSLIDQINNKSFDSNLDCSELYQSYENFKQPICQAVLPGIVEVLIISIIMGIFNILCTVYGVCFVIRNKIDIPKPKIKKQSGSALQSKVKQDNYKRLPEDIEVNNNTGNQDESSSKKKKTKSGNKKKKSNNGLTAGGSSLNQSNLNESLNQTNNHSTSMDVNYNAIN